MKKIKFCHLIDGSNFNPLLYNSIRFSDRQKIEYTVISLEAEDGLQEQMKELGIRAFSLNYSSRKQCVSALWRLYRLFRKEKFQIVQTHLFDASLIGLTAARLARIPVTIFTGHHSHEVPLYNRKILTLVDGLSGRFLAHYTIAPSNNMKEIFIKYQKVPEKKIEVIHHGFDLEKWRESSRKKTNLRKEFGIENKVIFGAVGRLFWVKAFENLIKAFAEVAKKRDDVVLLIIGGGEKKSLQELINVKGLVEKVILTGRREDIASVMSEFDVFVHSSLAESFGMVYIEVFALGKPVVGTKVGVAPEIIEDNVNGFLVETGNMKELAEAMLKMLENKDEWRNWGAKCQELAEDFDVQKTQAECDNFYFKCLEHK